MLQVKLILFILFSGCALLHSQQKYNVELNTINEQGEVVSNAYIIIDDIERITNYAGGSSLRLESGKKNISVSHISYVTYQEEINIQSDTSLYIILNSRSFKTIEINAKKTRRINSLSEINVQTLKNIPGITGNKDLIKALTFLPGVSSTTEGNVNFSVRGAESYQNAILIDRSQTYNISHLFGLLSTINSDIINDVKLYKNHIPSRFGNAGSSVVDISIKRGNNQKLQQKFDIGLTNMNYNLNGPLIKDKLHLNFSFRSAFLGILSSPLYFLYQRGDAEGYANYNLFDGNFKLSYSPTKKDRLSIHLYNSLDWLGAGSRSSKDNENKTSYGWSNRTLNLSYYRNLENGWFLNNFVNYSYFSTKLKNQSIDSSTSQESITGFERINEYNNINAQSELSKGFRNSVMRFGIHYDYSWFNPLRLVNIIDSETLQAKTNVFNLNTIGLFTDNDIQLNRRTSLNAGARLSIYSNENNVRVIPEPRISVKYEIDTNRFFECSYNRLSQNKVQYPIVNFGLPLEIWIPISQEVLPPVVNHFNLSYVSNNFLVDNLNLSSSIYYKEFNNLTTLRSVLPFFVEFDENYTQYLAKDGQGRALGLEIGLEYSNTILNAYAGYHLARSQRKFEDINEGNWYNFDFNRTHELNSYVDIKLSKKWRFTGSFNLSSGTPVGLPTAYIPVTENQNLFLFQERNNFRNPLYHRGDIAFTHKKLTKRNRIRKWTFSVYNFYYRQNAYDTTIELSPSGNFEIVPISVFPIIPTFLYSLEF